MKSKLTKREQQALELIEEGNAVKDISDELNIEVSTTYKHIQRIHKKTNTHSFSQIVLNKIGILPGKSTYF